LALIVPVETRAATVSVGPGQMYATIAEGTAAAGDGDTVEVEPGHYLEEIVLQDRTLILVGQGGAAAVTIESPGVGDPDLIRIVGGSVELRGFTIDAMDERRGLAVHASGQVLLDDVVIVGGVNADGFPGGGIGIWSYSRVTANGVVLADNSAYLGAMPYGGHVSVELDSTFASQLATSLQNGGAARGGGLYIDATSSAVLDDTAMTDNRTTGLQDHDGGAICAEVGSTLMVQDSAFFGNATAPNDKSTGGAIYAGDVEIYSSEFSGNGETHRGGAVAVESDTLLADGNLFDGNLANFGAAIYCRAASCDLIDNWFEDNEARRGGAVLISSGSVGLMTRNHFCHNRVPAPHAGADIGDGGAVLVSQATLTGTNNVFIENTAYEDGGAMALYDSTVTLTNNHFVSNGALRGGAVHVEGAFGQYASVNNLYGWNSTAISDPSGVATTRYSQLFQNGAVIPALGVGDQLGDPLLVGPVAGNCAEGTVLPLEVSPMIGGGDPQIFNPNGTESDVGAFGGPEARDIYFKDVDNDGVLAMFDCDDADTNETSPVSFVYEDNDLDGHGSYLDSGALGCGGVGFSKNNEDCDDGDPLSHEGTIWYADVDADGLGSPDSATAFCVGPPGWVETGTDCNDSEPSIGEGTLWYDDVDGDGLGDPDTGILACAPSSSQVGDATDCDDTDDTIGRALPLYADEDEDGYGAAGDAGFVGCPQSGFVSNANDCDDTEEALNPETPWYRDSDSDGVGGLSITHQCERPLGHVDLSGDCNDEDPSVGLPSLHLVDGDRDGWGGDEGYVRCPAPGFTELDGDCDDDDEAVHPGAPEQCDLVDSDCDGTLGDPESTDAITVHPDADSDGYGAARMAVMGCPNSQWLVDASDCDDGDPAVHPRAVEIWYDGIDQDCDGSSDYDQDQDGYDAYQEAADGDDCDDLDPAIHPRVEDIPNDGIDQNCDGVVAATWITGGVGCQTVPVGSRWLILIGLVLAVRTRRDRSDP